MGRHSAPGEPDDDAQDTADPALVVDLAPPRGRHWRGDDVADPDEQHTAVIGVIDADLAPDPDDHSQDTDVLPALEPDVPAAAAVGPLRQQLDLDEGPAGKKAARAARKSERGESNTQADLRMLRENSAVRARCIAAVIASFLVYTLVLLVVGRTDIYLMWIWIPIVLSGVLVGLFLDLAHRKMVRPSG